MTQAITRGVLHMETLRRRHIIHFLEVRDAAEIDGEQYYIHGGQ